ncbi:sterol desaturase family protein [Catalinimonas sp. 4WD22]|uniref:sterol desaturase family protein n=1 Tax=Catalinimonas locisalis TaxID=3133978 RepID=UPI003100FBDB
MDQIKLFKNPILNRLIFTNSKVAVSVYYTISIAITIYGFVQVDITIFSGLLLTLAGLLAFTLVEYLTHRFLYHSDEEYQENKSWQYLVHGIHHVYPKEHGLLALPIPVALLINAVLFLLFSFVVGEYIYFLFPGFLSGYATQLYIHYQVHTRKPPKNIFRFFWKHHMLHHYSSEKEAFGVITPLWDIVFGTMPEKSASEK